MTTYYAKIPFPAFRIFIILRNVSIWRSWYRPTGHTHTMVNNKHYLLREPTSVTQPEVYTNKMLFEALKESF